eukprot:g13076.t1
MTVFLRRACPVVISQSILCICDFGIICEFFSLFCLGREEIVKHEYVLIGLDSNTMILGKSHAALLLLFLALVQGADIVVPALFISQQDGNRFTSTLSNANATLFLRADPLELDEVLHAAFRSTGCPSNVLVAIRNGEM